MYRNLLVGYDGLAPSRAALREAALWVLKHGGEVTALNTVYFDSEEFSSVHSGHDERVRVSLEMCNAVKEEIRRDLGVDINTVTREGEPPEVILEVASKIGADLIVMGTYSRTGLKRLILGSVTSHVIVNSSVDVLVVKRGCDDCTGLYKSLLLPFDGSTFSKKALSNACHLAKADAAGVTALYVIPRYEEMLEFFKTEGIRASIQKEAARIIEEATGIVRSSGLVGSGEIREGSAAEEITKVAGSGRHDLIVMGSHGYRGVNRALLGSTAERVIIHATCPVLVVR